MVWGWGIGVWWGAPAALAEDFGDHLRAAIRLNRERAGQYAEASGGTSWPISRQLLWLERGAWLLSGLVDVPAHRYQRAGVPLLSREFVSMTHAPPLVLPDPTPPSLLDYVPVPVDALIRDLDRAAAAGDFGEMESSARLWLSESAAAPGTNCMTQHLLESVVAIAHFAPEHVQEARAAGLPDPHRLLGRLLRQHVRLLPHAALLDLRAVPLQVAGVPILCSDVPPILSVLSLEDPSARTGH